MRRQANAGRAQSKCRRFDPLDSHCCHFYRTTGKGSCSQSHTALNRSTHVFTSPFHICDKVRQDDTKVVQWSLRPLVLVRFPTRRKAVQLELHSWGVQSHVALIHRMGVKPSVSSAIYHCLVGVKDPKVPFDR